LPYSYDDSDGFYDRWIFFDYPYKFVDLENLNEDEKKIPTQFLKAKNPKMIEELSTQANLNGLFNWAVEVLHRLWKQNNFSKNQTSKDNRKKWKRQASSFNAFFEDHCEVDFETFTPNSRLKIAYKNYCKIHKLNFEGNTIIRSVLEKNGCDFDKNYIKFEENNHVFGESVRGWRGLKIDTSILKCDTSILKDAQFSDKSDAILPSRTDFFFPIATQSTVTFVRNSKNHKEIPKDYIEIGEEVLHDSDYLLDDLGDCNDL